MKRISILTGCLAGLLLTGHVVAAGSQPKAHSLKEAVADLVHHAQAGDTNHLTALLSSPAPGVAAQVALMIQRSGMLTNYTERLRSFSPTEARLDYHYPEKGCHFQVSLEMRGSAWEVARIQLCR
jgi:hypothetical protein